MNPNIHVIVWPEGDSEIGYWAMLVHPRHGVNCLVIDEAWGVGPIAALRALRRRSSNDRWSNHFLEAIEREIKCRCPAGGGEEAQS